MNGKVVRFLASCFGILPKFLRILLYDLIKPFSGIVFSELRYIFISSIFKSIGTGVYIGPLVTIKNAHRLSIGNNVSFHEYTYIDAYGGIQIGDDVSIAHACTLISTNHTWADATVPIKFNPVNSSPIKVEDNVWLGCGVRVLAGVKIATSCVIGAGAIVTKSCELSGLYVGSPAKFLKSLY